MCAKDSKNNVFIMDEQRICIPGERIAKASNLKAADGTYVSNGYICASLAGSVQKFTDENGQSSICVKSHFENSVVPAINSLVRARITKVNPRFCKCIILTVDEIPLREPFHGMIWKRDVRAKEKDKVEMYKCFRPSDIILARVLSLGDALSYVLTTAENELGVVVATSEAGGRLVPISWCEMQCPKTFAKEHRKVARVQSQYIQQL